MFYPMRKNKLPGRSYELLALKQAQLVPRHEVAIDLIGPYKMEKNAWVSISLRLH